MHKPTDPLPRRALLKQPRQPRSVEMVHTILDAGMLIIRQEGLAAMTTNRVAERAGISIGSLYQYFAHRDSILAGIIERSMLDFVSTLRQFRQRQLALPLDAVLGNIVRISLAYYRPYREEMRRVLRELPLLADNSASREMETVLLDMVRDYLLSNSERYRLRNGRAGLYVTVNAMLLMTLKWIADDDTGIDEDTFISAMITLGESCVEKLHTASSPDIA
jgi:AcrR family transcriptional regulator